MKKRSLIALLCVLACLTVFPVQRAMAADVAVVSESSEVMPLMEYIYDAKHDFYISGGRANIYAMLRGNSSLATKCAITVELQEKGILFWNTVESWSAVEYGRSAELSVSQVVTSGKSYRIVTTVTVWSGTDSETQTLTSDSTKA